MLLNLLSALVDGAGYGNGRGSSHTSNKETGFPRGVLSSYAWEGWWQEEPVMVSTPHDA